MSCGVSRDPKQCLKMVPGQKRKPEMVSLYFWNKKERFTNCMILRNNSLPIGQNRKLRKLGKFFFSSKAVSWLYHTISLSLLSFLILLLILFLILVFNSNSFLIFHHFVCCHFWIKRQISEISEFSGFSRLYLLCLQRDSSLIFNFLSILEVTSFPLNLDSSWQGTLT